MSAVLEFGFDAAPAFTGVDRLEQKLTGLNGTVARVSTAHEKLRHALKEGWVSAGIDAQVYLEKMRAVEKQERVIAASHQRLAAAGAGQYAAQQEASAAAAAQRQAMEAAAQQRAAAQAQAAAAAAAKQQTLEVAAQRLRSQETVDGRLQLQLIEARLAGNAKEGKQFELRIAQLAQMRQLQQQMNLSQKDAYALSSRMAAAGQLKMPGSMGGAGGGSGGGGKFAIGMAAMQMQDVAVQAQMGTRASIIIAQQGSQLASMFGPGGMIVGGIAAVGAVLYDMQEKGVEALKALQKEAGEFDQSLRHLKAGNLTEMIDGMEKMKQKADELRAATAKAPGALARFFAPSSFDAGSGKWSNSADEKHQVSAELAKKNEEGRAELMRQIVQTSEEELRIARLKESGHAAAAAALEREVQLRRKLAEYDAAPEEVRGQLKANAQAVSEAEAAAEAGKEKQKTADAQARLEDQKHKAGLDEMTLARQIATIRVEAAQATAEEARLRAAAVPDAMKVVTAESKKVELQMQLNQLQKRFADEKEREFNEAKRIAEQQEREAEAAKKKNNDRRSSVLDTAMEYKLLQAKARGNERAVEEAERQQRVLSRAGRLESENGMGRKEALAMAMKMTDLEDRANGKPGKIRGVVDKADPQQRNGLSGEWHSGPSGSGTYRGMGGPSDPLSKNGGLAGFWDLQAGNTGSSRGTSDYYNQNAFSDGQSIQEHHAANAKAKEEGENPGTNRLVDSFMDKLISRLPAALADAILTKS